MQTEPPYARRRRIDLYRSPCWRWQVAGKIARGECAGTTEPDPYLQAAIRMQTAIENGRRPRAKSLLEKSVLEARKIHEADDLPRAEIEARIVAGQSNEDIRQCTGIAAEVIEAYAEVFLDVRDRLSATDYLQVQLLEFQQFRGFTNDELRPLWITVAMDAGLAILDEFIRAFRAVHCLGDPATIDTYLRDGVPLSLQALVGGCVLPMTPLGGHLIVLLALELKLAKAESDPFIGRRRFETAQRRMIGYARMVLGGRDLPKGQISQLTKSMAKKQGKQTEPKPRSPNTQRPTAGQVVAQGQFGGAKSL